METAALMRPARGFTLLEVGVTLLIIVFLVMAGSIATSQVSNNKRYRAQRDADTLYNAEFGTRDVNGFVGDIGRLTNPASSNPTLASSEVLTYMPAALAKQQVLRGVTVGWKGPYVGYDPTSMFRDPWGNSWIVDNTTNTGRISSAGPDGVLGTADDISSPAVGYRTQQTGANVGELEVVVADASSGGDPVVDANLVDVDISNPDGSGNVAWVTANLVANTNYFRATGLATGRHVIRATGKNGFTGAAGYTATWVGGGTQGRMEVRLRF